MNILILGSSGKIGFKISEYLNTHSNYNTILHHFKNLLQSSKKNITIKSFDVTKVDNVMLDAINESDIIINCIGNYSNNKKMKLINDLFVKNLFNDYLEYFKNKPIHWIQISSIGVYDNSLRINNINEKSNIKFINYYEETKYKADLSIIKMAELCNTFSYTIIRPSILYGSKELDKTFLKLTKLLKNKFLSSFIDYDSNLPFIHINDLSNLVNKVIINKNNKAKNQIFNISDNVKINILLNIIGIKKRKNNKLFSINYLIINLITTFIDKIFSTNYNSKFSLLSKNIFYNSEKVFNTLSIKLDKSLSLINYYEKNY